ncbi:MAG TPA: hypothetical protein VKZ79_14270 [Alphaproteobacteria bacterium]|nr:hypothetical protein [Alphaproteobacteria bacterium]
MSRNPCFLFALVAACLLAGAPAFANCAKPSVKAPVMPQGATASEEEMREGHDKLQAYVKVLEAYQTCLEQQIKSAPPDTKPETKQLWQAQADAAVSAAQEIADVYSAQLRAYKSRD